MLGIVNFAKWGFSNLSTKSDAKVLDVGCGGGANVKSWLKRCKDGHVIGLD